MSEREAEGNNTMLSDAESSIVGMTPRAVVFKLAEAIAVARRRRSWAWIGSWMAAQGVKPQRSESINPRALANYLSDAKKLGLVNMRRVEELAKQLDERVRTLTLERVGAEDALRLLIASQNALGATSVQHSPESQQPLRHVETSAQSAAPSKAASAQLPSRWSRITPPALD